MKKIYSTFLALSLVLPSVGSVGRAATSTPLEELNKAIVELLAPLNNPQTKIEFKVGKAKVNEVRAVEAAGDLDYSKNLSEDKKADLKASLSYDYPETPQAAPKAQGKLTLTADLRKLLQQDFSKELAQALPAELQKLIRQQKDQFGEEAVTGSEKVTSEQADGQLVSLAATLKIKIDLSKVAEDLRKDVPFLALNASLTVNSTGATLELSLDCNAQHRSFDRDQTGLREAIEKLLQRDTQTLNGLRGMIQEIDQGLESFLKNKEER